MHSSCQRARVIQRSPSPSTSRWFGIFHRSSRPSLQPGAPNTTGAVLQPTRGSSHGGVVLGAGWGTILQNRGRGGRDGGCRERALCALRRLPEMRWKTCRVLWGTGKWNCCGTARWGHLVQVSRVRAQGCGAAGEEGEREGGVGAALLCSPRATAPVQRAAAGRSLWHM